MARTHDAENEVAQNGGIHFCNLNETPKEQLWFASPSFSKAGMPQRRALLLNDAQRRALLLNDARQGDRLDELQQI